MMAGGLVKEGCGVEAEAQVGQVVQIRCVTCTNAMALGVLKMSPSDIKPDTKGISVENILFLGDGV
eukprot:CAMPEP_0116924702 /NCGR_PEP_ID=MMETSP0467-20121206/23675_1 /TAXON_ID=283647 /ORGANISM="Mesodinium pulex, Strain SPMC105" /LENGTH=65 /DNA_ID=CAMNT_0004603595 /DNA_START=334 /DNA_END=531 /DNA_ORIENTATION=+